MLCGAKCVAGAQRDLCLAVVGVLTGAADNHLLFFSVGVVGEGQNIFLFQRWGCWGWEENVSRELSVTFAWQLLER